MSIRPPTLREKRRYLLARVEPAGTVIDQKDLYYAITDAATSLWGDSMAAVITPAVVAAEHGYVVVRCRRGTERELAIALSTVTTCRDTRLALRLVAASGTIESLRERIGRTPPREEQPLTGEVDALLEKVVDGRSYFIRQDDGQKVNLFEKGFKNTNRLFMTREDMEDI
jgi:ribonuclease P/MRP protein subunit POP5